MMSKNNSWFQFATRLNELFLVIITPLQFVLIRVTFWVTSKIISNNCLTMQATQLPLLMALIFKQ